MKHQKVVVADSHEIVCDGIKNAIEAHCNATVVGQAFNGYTTIKQCHILDPDILLMDFGLSNPSGMDIFEKVRAKHPNMKIVVISSNLSNVDAYVLLARGAAGFVPKQASGTHFANAINTISIGYTCISARYLQGFVGLQRNASRTGNIYGLSRREMEVLEQSTTGANTQEIATRLNISVRTVETHRNAIYRKTSTNSIASLHSVAQTVGVLGTIENADPARV